MLVFHTIDQNPEMQIDALNNASCDHIYTEKISGSYKDRFQLKAALDFMRAGDTLVIWKLSRLARSLKQIIATASDLEVRNIGLQVLTQNIDTK